MKVDSLENNVLILTVGLPYSGKSTWARRHGAPVVCPDAIRVALHGQRFVSEAEPHVWAIAKTMVRALFMAGHQIVILDATNNTRKRRDEWKGPWFREFKVRTEDSEVCQLRAVEAHDKEILPIIDKMAEAHEPVTDEEREA